MWFYEDPPHSDVMCEQLPFHKTSKDPRLWSFEVARV